MQDTFGTGPTSSDPPTPIFRSAAGRFAVALPGPPVESEQVLPTPLGPIRARTFGVQGDDGACFVVYADYPEDALRGQAPEGLLNGACLGMVMNLAGAILASRALEPAGAVGREVDFEFPRPGLAARGLGRARLFLAGARLYQVFVIGFESRVNSSESRNFLESFRIIPDAASFVAPRPHPSGPGSPPRGF